MIQPLPSRKPEASFIFPYSEDTAVRRQQVWQNLEKGILFEDIGILIPWSTPFLSLDELAEERKDSGDRTNWFLGKHNILDNYSCHVGVMKWVFVNNAEPFSEIDEWLGYDEEGCQKFLLLKDKFTELLGDPAYNKLEKFGDLDLGSIKWTNGKVRVSLVGIEQFACKYRLYVGLEENKNR